jgi:hypothetical protein
MKTNYELGTDSPAKATDYQNRFSQTQNAFRQTGNVEMSPTDENKRNKAKMTSDSIRIAGNDFFDRTVSSKIQF